MPVRVLAAWGSWWPSLDELIPDRLLAPRFAAESPLVQQQQFPSNQWFMALTQIDFMLCPLGNGIQAPKMVEAVLMGCIPIATKHPTFVELDRRGLPILLVDRWEDVTREVLEDSYSSLFARVTAFRGILLDLDEWWRFSFPCHEHEPAPLII